MLVIGKRDGKFRGMLKERTFRIVWVKPGHGIGAEATSIANDEAHYSGKALTLRCP